VLCLYSNNKGGIFKKREKFSYFMTVPISENHNKNLLERLKYDNKDVRINYIGEKMGPFFGKIKEIAKHDILLLPYAVFEPVPTPNMDKSLNRYRIEKEYAKVLPLMNILPEPLSENYIEDFIKLQNYFSSLMIADNELRDKTFDKKIYLMPSKEEIEFFKKALPKKEDVLKDNKT
jgi:hypothetical protein